MTSSHSYSTGLSALAAFVVEMRERTEREASASTPTAEKANGRACRLNPPSAGSATPGPDAVSPCGAGDPGLRRVCSWCERVLEEGDPGALISHGICPECFERAVA